MNKTSPIAAFLLLPLLSSCSVFSGWGEPEIDHVSLPSPAEPLDIPENVSSVGWTWEAPDETSVVHVSPIPYGLSVSVSDGIVAVSGDAGEELWRYRRPGEDVTSTSVTPDGETIAVSYRSEEGSGEESGSSSPHEVVLLDSSTGEIRGTHVAEFVTMDIITDDIRSFRSVDERIGVVSNNSRFIYRENDDGGKDVVSLDLESGEELWSISPTPTDGNEDSVFVPRDAVVSRDVLILSTTFMDRSVESAADLDQRQDHTIALIGIDTETGSETWRHELEVEAPIEAQPFRLGVEQSSGMLTAVARGNDYHGEWILDPTTGETLTDEVFFAEDKNTVVGILEEAIVNVREISDGDEYEYSYVSLAGEVQQTATVNAPLERWEDSFILTLEDSIAWLDVNETGSSSWGQAQLVITDWNNEESRVIDLGVEVQRRPNNDGSMGNYAPIPTPVDMTLAPGALVIAEDLMAANGESRRLVGLVP